ncbi:hypothetical protein PJW08_14640 [Tenacibaculum finnmarkense]|nr:hypothetical protein PJW08_14640 [Tenacibaculum finnmarkense]
MKKMTSINLDKWRTLNEDLFKAYVYTYEALSKDNELNPNETLVRSFEGVGILKTLTKDGYGTAYTIAREIGVYYQDGNNYILSNMAKSYLKNELTYSDFLKYYCLNIEFLINNEVIHPLSEILEILKNNNFNKQEIKERVPKLIPTDSSSATDCLRLFLNRCVEAGLLKEEKKIYSLNYNYNILKGSINSSNYSALSFENKFISGDQSLAQKNIVTKLLEREIPNLFKHSFYIKKENVAIFSSEDRLEKQISNPITQIDFEINKFIKSTNIAGLIYSEQLVTRYVSSLATKPFVLLSGLSGSGKTKLAQSFAQWVCETEKQYCIVPVGADWTNREPLLGYVNALDNTEYILPENGALQLIIEANKVENQNKPYFLILDEMNLSHVERYFADFLSVMESKDKFKLHSSEINLNITVGDKFEKSIEVPNSLNWPKNLFVVGTVNIDETTYMFSPKVLDRANAIEFRVTEKEISNFLNSPNEIDLTQLESEGASMAASFIEIAKNKEFETIDTASLNKTLVNFFAELKKARS